ncbi:MAG: TIGR03621 family F420-dependent LLM class oxidoreductase, partial [Acidimicrobiia bacterium]|nr:TIGR03621 family F420-dependent LLM class oxidoreductase [Acidimicrobiia bacterium]
MSSSSRPFRFGAVCEHATTRQEWAETARRIEGAGFSTLLVPDHFDERFGPFTALMAAADATTTLRLGTLVLGNDYRHPVVLAKEAATLDVLSGGRFELGIGAGWEQRDYDWSGIAFDEPAARVERLEESVAVLKGLFDDGSFSYGGRHYVVSGLEGTPKPAQRPHPPLLIGAGGRRMLALAAHEADIVNVNFRLDAGVFGHDVAATGTAEATRSKVAWLRECAGERFAELELGITVFAAVITNDRDSVAKVMGSALGLTTEGVLDSPHVLVGSVDQVVEELSERREAFGFSYIAFALDTYEAMLPVAA